MLEPTESKMMESLGSLKSFLLFCSKVFQIKLKKIIMKSLEFFFRGQNVYSLLVLSYLCFYFKNSCELVKCYAKDLLQL